MSRINQRSQREPGWLSWLCPTLDLSSELELRVLSSSPTLDVKPENKIKKNTLLQIYMVLHSHHFSIVLTEFPEALLSNVPLSSVTVTSA